MIRNHDFFGHTFQDRNSRTGMSEFILCDNFCQQEAKILLTGRQIFCTELAFVLNVGAICSEKSLAFVFF